MAGAMSAAGSGYGFCFFLHIGSENRQDFFDGLSMTLHTNDRPEVDIRSWKKVLELFAAFFASKFIDRHDHLAQKKLLMVTRLSSLLILKSELNYY